MVTLLPPWMVERLRAGKVVAHPQRQRNVHLTPDKQPYAYPQLARGRSHCRSCGARIPRGETVLVADLFLEGTPLNALRPTPVFLHPEPCHERPEYLFNEQRRERKQAWDERTAANRARRQRERDELYNRVIARHNPTT